MPGEGFTFNMISSLRGNNSLLKKKGYFQIRKEYLNAARSERIDIKKATPEQLRAVRQKIILSNQVEQKRKIIALIISLVLTPLVMWGLVELGIWWFNGI